MASMAGESEERRRQVVAARRRHGLQGEFADSADFEGVAPQMVLAEEARERGCIP